MNSEKYFKDCKIILLCLIHKVILCVLACVTLITFKFAVDVLLKVHVYVTVYTINTITAVFTCFPFIHRLLELLLKSMENIFLGEKAALV